MTRPTRNLRREDFALEAVPDDFRRPGHLSLFGVLLAIPSALVFFVVGGSLQQTYGTVPLLIGLAVAGVIVGVAGAILTSFASHSGLASDLISIPAGFGLAGSAITSVIYSVNFVVLFALEDGIVASAVHAQFPEVPKVAVFSTVAIVVMALAWRGISSLAKVMMLTLAPFAILLLLACLQAAQAPGQASFWSAGPPGEALGATGWLSVLAALLAFIVNAAVAADIGRFLRPHRRRAGSFLFGAGLQVACFGGATLLGAWLTHRLGGTVDAGAYLVTLLGGWGVACVILSQLRINLINAYSGSLSLSNFGARGLGVRPGRHIWMAVLVLAGTALAAAPIHPHLVSVLTFEAVFVMAWVSTLVSYILLEDLHDQPARDLADFSRQPSINSVGLGGLAVALAVATPLAFGAAGELGKALAPLLAAGLAPAGIVLMRRWTWAQAKPRFMDVVAERDI